MPSLLRAALLLLIALSGCEKPAPEPPPTPGTIKRSITLPNGTYDGETLNGRMHGYGTLVIVQRGVPAGTYVGMFENGQAHGPATVTFHETAAVYRVEATRGCVQVGLNKMSIGKRLAECSGW